MVLRLAEDSFKEKNDLEDMKKRFDNLNYPITNSEK